MKTLYMTKGLPASGKTTAAKALVASPVMSVKRVNKDDLRAMIDGGRWSPDNEKMIVAVRDDLVSYFLSAGHHVVVDDTNFVSKHEARLRDLARMNKAAFKVMDFTDVSPEECIKRDLIRPNSVGSKVIMDMYNKYLKPVVIPPALAPALDWAVICDIDGTVAKNINRGFFEWDKVDQDVPRNTVVQMVKDSLRHVGRHLVFVSGRDGVCFAKTKDWLIEIFGNDDFELFMRPPGDMRRDSIVKREIYENYIKGRYNVAAIFDDRPQVIRECWQELGFGDRIFNVGTGEEF